MSTQATAGAHAGYALFLGGTAANNDWRDGKVIPVLAAAGVPAAAIFNPVVSDWNAEAQAREDAVKATAPVILFYLADPKMKVGTEKGQTIPLNIDRILAVQARLYEIAQQGGVTPVLTYNLDGLGGPASHAHKQVVKMVGDLKARFPTLIAAEEGAARAPGNFEPLSLSGLATDGEPLSAYSYFEAFAALHDDPARAVVIFDNEGLTGRSLGQARAIHAGFVSRFPGAPIFDDVAAGVRHLVGRLTAQ